MISWIKIKESKEVIFMNLTERTTYIPKTLINSRGVLIIVYLGGKISKIYKVVGMNFLRFIRCKLNVGGKNF